MEIRLDNKKIDIDLSLIDFITSNNDKDTLQLKLSLNQYTEKTDLLYRSIKVYENSKKIFEEVIREVYLHDEDVRTKNAKGEIIETPTLFYLAIARPKNEKELREERLMMEQNRIQSEKHRLLAEQKKKEDQEKRRLAEEQRLREEKAVGTPEWNARQKKISEEFYKHQEEKRVLYAYVGSQILNPKYYNKEGDNSPVFIEELPKNFQFENGKLVSFKVSMLMWDLKNWYIDNDWEKNPQGYNLLTAFRDNPTAMAWVKDQIFKGIPSLKEFTVEVPQANITVYQKK